MPPQLKICAQRKAILESSSHLLILGGPGSGKTTIAVVKAGEEMSNKKLGEGQKILFLSFARATVARVAVEAKNRVQAEHRSQLEISTYHGFAWSFIQTHGYLLTGHRRLRLLPPPEAAGRLAGVPKDDRHQHLKNLLNDERLLGFDLFAGLAAELLTESPRLCRLIADCYPIIIVDEFQDTNSDEWTVISSLGQHSRLIALADLEQRIYEFRGADPARIGAFISAFSPHVFDFGQENNRSDGTDINKYGNDLLTGFNIGKSYSHVSVEKYRFYKTEPLRPVKYALFKAYQRLIRNQTKDWSIAVLVNSKDFMLKTSNYFSMAGELGEVYHDALIDPEGPSLAAVLIGGLLEEQTIADWSRSLVTDLVGHLRGCGGGDISQQKLELSHALEKFRDTGAVRGSKRLELAQNIRDIVAARADMIFTGDPAADWFLSEVCWIRQAMTA